MPRKKKKVSSQTKARKRPADKPRAKSPKKKRASPARTVIRRNAAPATVDVSDEVADTAERTALTAHIDEMGGSHMAAGIGAGAVGNAASILMVGQGLIGPKWAATLLMGTGAAATAAGWYWEMDHLMAAGIGITASGAFSVANQLAVEAHDAIEKRAEEKRARRDAEASDKARAQRLAEARALLEAEKNKTRNAARFVILDEDGQPLDFELMEAA